VSSELVNVIDKELHHTDEFIFCVAPFALIYPKEFEIKETTETAFFASFLDSYLKVDINGQLYTKLYMKRDDFNLAIINVSPFDNISQLIGYTIYRACSLNEAKKAVSVVSFISNSLGYINGSSYQSLDH
jgi:hypothetical protein